MSRLKFELEAEAPGSRARATRFQTLHGEVKTPIFMPVGTQASVKGQSVESLWTTGSRVLLANTYHLLLRPGPEVFRKFGGIHQFMNWKGSVLTDSGGYQIFSLTHAHKIDEAGAMFKSYVDGSSHLLSPETSIGMQRVIGSDIMMVLDQCIPSTSTHAQAKDAMELTHRWAQRSLDARGDSPQAMFGIVQGACFEDLRRQSVEVLSEMPFDGLAIGGLAVGETKQAREDFTEWTAQLMPKMLPRYLMGVGTPIDILEAVHRGVDMFDCIIPSAYAQRGTAFTSLGKFQIRRAVYKFSEDKLDPDCECGTCRKYSRAYLHHLQKADEPLGWHLLTQHNLTFYHRLMSEMRQAILDGTFLSYYQAKRPRLNAADEANPVFIQPPRKRRDPFLGDYEVSASQSGHWSIRQRSSGEVMHPLDNPLEEAERIYIQQSRLTERVQAEPGTSEPHVLWDVGLGAGMNAMTAIRSVQGVEGPVRPLRLVSFERDLDPLRLALKHPDKFRHLHHAAPRSLLEEKRWSTPDGRLSWELVEGDFAESLDQAPAPDLIYYDPFSTRTDRELWTLLLFSKLFSRVSDRNCELYTYSCSTSVRSALLAAGFYVASGVSTGTRPETTIAYSRINASALPAGLLGKAWFDKWHRSQGKYPLGLPEGHRTEFENKILNHPQLKFSLN